MPETTPAIEICDLIKCYGDSQPGVPAVDQSRPWVQQ